ncbi:MAG: Bax inhibitor-1/YccA family protein [Spirochaetaceae bacterium]|nr:Bax inhibitor-1/YccA family protein [Spirochaetaceae bacterium]
MLNRDLSLSPILAIRQNRILRNVYLWMTGGLAFTAVIALGVSSNPTLMRGLLSNPILFYGLVIGELLLVMFIAARITRLSPTAATGSFVLYAGLNGVTLSVLFLLFTEQSIATAFLVAAGTFAGTSVWGFTTKRDLTTVGHYAGMAVWGILLALVVNMFLRSPALDYLVSLIGVGVFVALTAYDTQTIKRWNEDAGADMGEDDFVRLSILGALKLYIDFINIFLFLVRLFGSRE